MQQKTDTLIVGAGLAGSCLALQLLKQNHPFLLIDHAIRPKASMVAAGLINPIVFRYLTMSWEAERNLNAAIAFYSDAATKFNKNFYHPLPIARIFGENESENWNKKAQQKPFLNYIKNQTENLSFHDSLFAKHGFGIVNGGGWIDISALIVDTTELLKNNNQIIDSVFDFSQLRMHQNHIQYKHIEAKNLVFCEGSDAIGNPFFNFIPFRPVKGELLDIHVAGLDIPMIINKDIFLLPLGSNHYKCGSTYDWEDLSLQPTLKAKSYLEEKLSKLLRLPYEIIAHRAGVRPAVADRRPVCGRHPVHERLWIMNGLGAKGALLAPYLAVQLQAQLAKTAAAVHDIDPARFWKA